MRIQNLKLPNINLKWRPTAISIKLLEREIGYKKLKLLTKLISRLTTDINQSKHLLMIYCLHILRWIPKAGDKDPCP